MAPPPKADIQITETPVGMMRTQVTNSRTERPREMRAMSSTAMLTVLGTPWRWLRPASACEPPRCSRLPPSRDRSPLLMHSPAERIRAAGTMRSA